MIKKRVPSKLYKYRAFNVNTLTMLDELKVFYADPKSFNDPFDCDLKFEIDKSYPTSEIEHIWHSMLSKSTSPKMLNRIKSNHMHMADEVGHFQDGAEGEAAYKSGLLQDIESELSESLSRRGVLSLATKWDCRLMWSHYADEHRGICIEYDTKAHRCNRLGPVNYDSSRNISISEVVEWKVLGSETARTKIVDAYFFAKQSEWKYEKEWRDIAHSEGATSQPFERITAIYFGYRCPSSVRKAVMGILRHHGDEIKYYEIDTTKDGFKLLKTKTSLPNVEEDEYSRLLTTQPISFIFDRLDPYTDEELFNH